MPRFFIGISAVTLGPWLVLVGCGESSRSNDGGAGGGTSQAAGADAAGVSAGKASGGNATAGSTTSSGAAGGYATGASTGSAGDSGSGSAGGSETDGEGGGSVEGLVSCDPNQASCKMPPGECPVMQVRAVVGACWGDCVEIDQCACNSAAECPDSNQYTCWTGRHCGPYVN